MTALAVSGARKSYGEVQALDGVDFEIHPAEAVGLLGPNGSGKSTLLRSITTLERLDAGSITIADVDVAAAPAAARGRLGYAGQEPAIDKVMTGREFLRFQAGVVHLPKAEIAGRVTEMLERLDLVEAADRLCEGYSGGMKRRLDLAASLMHRPLLLVLDEPSAGLDLDARRRLWDFLSGLRAEGTALLVATHDFEEADALCNRVVLLSKGRVVDSGTPDDLRAGLGAFVIGASLHEHPRAGDADRLATIFAGVPGRALPPDPRRAEFDWVLTAPLDDPSAGEIWAGTLQEKARKAGTPLFSVTVRRPGLQDVYRAAVAPPPPEEF